MTQQQEAKPTLAPETDVKSSTLLSREEVLGYYKEIIEVKYKVKVSWSIDEDRVEVRYDALNIPKLAVMITFSASGLDNTSIFDTLELNFVNQWIMVLENTLERLYEHYNN